MRQSSASKTPRRTNVPAIIQSAIARAQFETIHPFNDGYGRTVRELLHVMPFCRPRTRSHRGWWCGMTMRWTTTGRTRSRRTPTPGS
ncbi:Fic family protein [Arthrobacter sp. PsM3]|uniref:Fic family protein n=1 Tax=Arthrobacter sp. PsM3 TaxID=3030531 RepID=UPI00346040FF